MEIEGLTLKMSKEKQAALHKFDISQLEEAVDVLTIRAKICKSVGDDKSLEAMKKEIELLLKKIEENNKAMKALEV